MNHTRLAGMIILLALLCGCGSTPAGPAPSPAAPPATLLPVDTATAPAKGSTGQTQTPALAVVEQATPEETSMPKPVPTTASTPTARQSPANPNPPAQPRQPTTSIVGIPAAALPAVERARADLAQQLGIATETIEVLGVQQRYRPSAPSDSPGQADGWQIQLAAGGTRYSYRVDAQGKPSRIRTSQ